MGIMTYGREPITLGETVVATVAVFIGLGFLGMIFSFIIIKFSSQNYLLKSWLFGVFIWFGSYAITLLFGVPELAFIPLNTTVSNFLGASIWGLTLGVVLNWLDDRLKV